MIKISNLGKWYGDKCVLQDINLEFEAGKIYGVLGRNGAGKTTLVNIITNRAFATSGLVEIDGLNAYENDRAQANVFCITEKSEYPKIEKVKNLIKWASKFYPTFDKEYAFELAKRFDLDTEKKLGKLSTGYTTIVKVILTLASGAKVMIFDEPVLGIDAIYRKVFYEELKRVHAKLRNTMILATHILDEAESIVDQVIILKGGVIILNEKTPKKLQDLYLGLHEDQAKGIAQTQTATKPTEKPKREKCKFTNTDPKKIKHSVHYLLLITWASSLIIAGLVVFFTIIPIFLDAQFAIDIMLVINVLIIGMSLYTYFFKYALYNGISRRTYITSTFIVLLIYTFATALFGSLGMLVGYLTNTSGDIFTPIYVRSFDTEAAVWTYHAGSFTAGTFFTMFSWLLMFNIFAATLGLMLMIIFQLLSRKGRYIMMGVATVLGLGITMWGILAPASAGPLIVLLFLFGLTSFSVPSAW
ncbi:MAG: ABC transporter ATP-binding protein, partial [Firmicutes bacterium]|nr:ABC transporter ATP-binding protein [Bacillota bacterium]